MVETTTARPRILVLRYHSLGDVVLTSGIVQALAHDSGGPIDLVTEAAYLPVFRGHPAIGRLWERGALEQAVSAETREGQPRYDRVIDLQGTNGSGSLARRLGPVQTVRSRGLVRRWVVLWGDRFPRPRVPHVIERYAEAAGLEVRDGRARYRPVVRVLPEEEDEARRLAPRLFETPGPVVLCLTGASRRTKAFPVALFRKVGEALSARGWSVFPVAAPGEPDAEDLVIGGRHALCLGLGPLKAALARADLAISCDSGPMHLASALGRPVLALFGSSVRAFGFAPTGERDRVLEVEGLACRPCGVHGRNRCWLGHWRCLRDLPPERVVDEAVRLGTEIGLVAQARPA